MYSKLPNLVIGFHGCDRLSVEKVLYKNEKMHESVNDYDWLGHGVYFWEQNYDRALDWAASQLKIKTPAVIGAVIDLGRCLNLFDKHYIDVVKKQYETLKDRYEFIRKELPRNKNVGNNTDLLLRNLDCTVIESLHEDLKITREPEYDSVRGMFFEGKEIYPGSGFRSNTHVQICVRNPNCIKGLFLPKASVEEWSIP
ncbi:MAG: hypothetical protein LBM59_07810 [Ruminococcus sp.]|jgi:hypothetical protein|nr:hypothetical protein [Ruminococcus sp.]